MYHGFDLEIKSIHSSTRRDPPLDDDRSVDQKTVPEFDANGKSRVNDGNRSIFGLLRALGSLLQNRTSNTSNPNQHTEPLNPCGHNANPADEPAASASSDQNKFHLSHDPITKPNPSAPHDERAHSSQPQMAAESDSDNNQHR